KTRQATSETTSQTTSDTTRQGTGSTPPRGAARDVSREAARDPDPLRRRPLRGAGLRSAAGPLRRPVQRPRALPARILHRRHPRPRPRPRDVPRARRRRPPPRLSRLEAAMPDHDSAARQPRLTDTEAAAEARRITEDAYRPVPQMPTAYRDTTPLPA